MEKMRRPLQETRIVLEDFVQSGSSRRPSEADVKLVLLYCVTGQQALQARLAASIADQQRLLETAAIRCPYVRVLITDLPKDAIPVSTSNFFDDFVNDVQCFIEDPYNSKRYFSLSKMRNAGLRYAAAHGFDWALLCDSDTVIADYSLELPEGGFGVPQVYWQKAPTEDVFESLEQIQNPDENTFSKGNSWFLISSRIFRNILFNEKLYGYGCEDVEYEARALADGTRNQVTSLRIIHRFHTHAERGIEQYSFDRNRALLKYVLSSQLEGHPVDVDKPLDAVLAKHRDWEGALILFPETGRLIHLDQRQEANYRLNGRVLWVDWDNFGEEIFVFRGEIFVKDTLSTFEKRSSTKRLAGREGGFVGAPRPAGSGVHLKLGGINDKGGEPPVNPVPLKIAESKTYSQNGEDGVIGSIFKAIGNFNRFYVEIGCGDGAECNTRKLSQNDGWTGIRIDNQFSDPRSGLFRHTITPENACNVLQYYAAPDEFDLLSLCINFDDFHVLRAVLDEFSPRVVISGFNASRGPELDCVVPYIRGQHWDGTDFFGASYMAFRRLALFYGYKVVYCESNGVNIFLVRDDIISEVTVDMPDRTFKPPAYGGGRGHPPDPQQRRYLTSEHYLLPGVATSETPYGMISYFRNDIYIGSAFSHGVYWDAKNIDVMQRCIYGESGMVLDVGAHIGSHSIALAVLNPHLQFTCFEPQRPIFLLLERNIYENRLVERFKVLNAAASFAAGEINLAATVEVEETSGRAAIDYGGPQPVNLGGVQLGIDGQRCRAICIDEMNLPPVIYIKVDVEGAEPLVFFGMRKLLARDLPYVLFEDREDRRLDRSTLETICGADEAIQNFFPRSYLTSLGYRTERLNLDHIAYPPIRAQPLLQWSDTNGPIPPRIFQTWKSKREFPTNFELWSSTFLHYNPNFEHIIWDDRDNDSFIQRYFPWFLESYREYPQEIYRADAVRYFFLYTFGGIYADMDTECLRPLSGLLDRGDVLLGRMGSNASHPHSIPNAIMASRPRQEFWLLVMWLMLDAAKRDGPPEYRTGPVILKSAVDLYAAQDPQWVRSAIDSIARRLPVELQPVPEMSRVEILLSREWFALDWTDPIHQRLRRDILEGRQLPENAKKEVFSASSMVTYWSHSWP